MFSKTPSIEQVHETPVHKTTTNTKKKRREYQEHILNNTTRTSGTVRTYSYDQISKHNTPTDLWMVLHGNVYDATSVIDSHPGGAEVLLDCGGMDATIAFDEVGHSRDSVLMLDPLFVGIVDEDGALDSSVMGGVITDSGQLGRRSSLSPTWEYTSGPINGDGAIKNSITGQVENVSLGESEYFKKIRLRKQKKKKQTIKDEHLIIILALGALLAALAYYKLEKRKWDDY